MLARTSPRTWALSVPGSASLSEAAGVASLPQFAMAVNCELRDEWLYRVLILFFFGNPFRAWPAPPDCRVEIP